jgi:hypothetical protein
MAKTTEIKSVPASSEEEPTVDTDIRTYEIRMQGDRFRIDIPANFKVTFGSLTPGSKYGGAMALRVYESETKQRAVFTDVVSFRDLSIPVRKYVKNTKSRAESERDSKGHRGSHEVEFNDEWVEQE